MWRLIFISYLVSLISAILFLIAIPSNCKAEDMWGVATVRSFHLPRGQGYNEANYGAGLEYNRFGLGFYDNSLRRTTIYAGYSFLPYQKGNWHLGISGILATGYDVKPVVFTPAFTAMYEEERFGVNIFSVGLVTGLQLKVKF